jgi:4-hydroxyphenylpyruvate dioxygenase
MSKKRLCTVNTATFSAPLPIIAAAAGQAGFTGLEVWKDDILRFPGGAPAVNQLFRGAGLTLSTFQLLRDFEGSDASELRERQAEAGMLMDLMQEVSADTLLVCANTRLGSSGDRSRQLADLAALADMAASRHLRIAFEPLAWSRWINTYEDTWKCVAAVDHPALGLTLDMFHLFHRGTPPEFLDQIPLAKIFGVQLCNAAPMTLPVIEIARHHRLLPTAGPWPVAQVVQRLESRGYDGFYSIEVFNDVLRMQDPFHLAARAWRSFCDLFVDP